MRDRLIELLREGEDNTPCGRNPDYDCTGRKCSDCERESIADYLLANGVIVPPVKVGDTVYSWLYEWKKECGISPYQITNITITQNKKGVWTKKYRAMQLLGSKTIDWQINFSFDEIGKTVFLTREEAEAVLKGGAE